MAWENTSDWVPAYCSATMSAVGGRLSTWALV